MALQDTAQPGISLPPPKSFDGTGANWPKWKQRFLCYRTGSRLSQKPREEQVSVFLYTMGDIANDIMKTMNTDEETIELDALIAKFDGYYGARKNTIMARAIFNKRMQKSEEPVETFIQDLYKLSEDCEYGPLKEDLIRDRIVVGVFDDALSNELQAKADLTLDLAVQISQQLVEERKESQHLIRRESTAVNAVGQPHPKERYFSSTPRKDMATAARNSIHATSVQQER